MYFIGGSCKQANKQTNKRVLFDSEEVEKLSSLRCPVLLFYLIAFRAVLRDPNLS